MGHCVVEEAEKLLDKEFPILDKGFIRLVDYLGSDQRIVQSARVSYGDGTKSYRQDQGLINYLLRNDHTSPFEQVVFTFHIKAPIFVARQWVRHRTARMNEISGRYSVMQDECYIPDDEHIAKQAEDNKQGREKTPIDGDEARIVREKLQESYDKAFEVYNELLDKGIAREISRINLPLSMYTEFYWQIDLHNLFHFLALRLDSHAQYEIRVYAEKMLEIVRAVCPLATQAFEKHKIGGAHFSKAEIDTIRQMINGGENTLKGRDRELFEEKLKQ